MNLFLKYLFLFFIGSMVGWVIELFYRKLVHKKWVNPGFLVGPYLPMYGFGLCFLTLIYTIFDKYPWYLNIILMGITMTLIELIGGLIFLKSSIKLWDYSNQPLNYKGIICPTFSLIWTIIGAIYYFYLANPVMKMLDWFWNNLSFSFILGVFFGIIIIDCIHSTGLFIKLKKYAKEMEIDIKYEELKIKIRELKEKRKEKYSFLNAFGNTKLLHEYLLEYKKEKKEKFWNKLKLKTERKKTNER